MAATPAGTNGARQKAAADKPKRELIMPPLPPVEPDTAAEQDFAAFWDEFRAEVEGKTVNILGVDVVVPTDAPLYFDDLQNRMAAAESDSDPDSPAGEETKALYEEMLALLFGPDTYEQWKTNGVTGMQLRILTVWGMANAQGKPTTFRQAGEIVKQAIADEAAGKLSGPNRADRRAAARKPASSRTRASTKTGQPSKRTSGGSTASRRTS